MDQHPADYRVLWPFTLFCLGWQLSSTVCDPLSPSSCLVSPLRRLRLRLYLCVWDRGRAENLFAWLQSSPYYWMCSIEHLSVYKMLMMVSDKWLSILSFLGSLYISYPLERQYNKSFIQGHPASSAKLSILSRIHDRFVAFSCIHALVRALFEAHLTWERIFDKKKYVVRLYIETNGHYIPEFYISSLLNHWLSSYLSVC